MTAKKKKVAAKGNNPNGRVSLRPQTAKKLPCARCGKTLGIAKFAVRHGTVNMNSYCQNCLREAAQQRRQA